MLLVPVGYDEEEIEVWTDEDDLPAPNSIDLLQCSTSYPQTTISMVNWILTFIYFLRFKFGISDAVTSLLLKFFKILFTVLGRSGDICRGVGDTFPGTLH